MTEEEWLTGTDLDALVRFASERVSRRKMLLFACVVAETVIHDPTTLGGQALELVERYAEGPLASEPVEEGELMLTQSRVRQRLGAARHADYGLLLAMRILDVALSGRPATFRDEMWGLLSTYRRVQRWEPPGEGKDPLDRPLLARLRDICGNPFRPAAVRPEWLVWNDGQVPRLARAIYDERRYAELPYLADALEDAGCADAALLGHLRGGGPHVRGCWAMDLLAGLG